MNGEKDRHTDTDRERAMGVGGSTTLVTAGKHVSRKVAVSSSGCHTVLGQATSGCHTGTDSQGEKEGAGGAAVHIAGTQQSNTAQHTGGGRREESNWRPCSMLLQGGAVSALQASLTSYRSYHLPTHLLVDQSFVPHGL